MPTVQTTDDFNHAIDAGYYTAAFWGTPSAVTSPLYQSQPKSLLVPANGDGNDGARVLITGSGTKGWMAFALRLETLPTVNDVRIANMEDAAGTEARMAIATNGNVYVYVTGGSAVNYSGNPMVADTWYWIEFIFDVNDGTGVKKMYWRVNGVDQTTATLAATASTAAHGQLFSAFGGGTMDWYAGIWKLGLASTTSDWLGEPAATQILVPDADLTTDAWTTTPLWSKLNDASDATLITATAT